MWENTITKHFVFLHLFVTKFFSYHLYTTKYDEDSCDIFEFKYFYTFAIVLISSWRIPFQGKLSKITPYPNSSMFKEWSIILQTLLTFSVIYPTIGAEIARGFRM